MTNWNKCLVDSMGEKLVTRDQKWINANQKKIHDCQKNKEFLEIPKQEITPKFLALEALTDSLPEDKTMSGADKVAIDNLCSKIFKEEKLSIEDLHRVKDRCGKSLVPSTLGPMWRFLDSLVKQEKESVEKKTEEETK